MWTLPKASALGTLLLFVSASHGCALMAWNCRRAQKSGPVTTVSGRIEAGQVISHLVPYDQEGSQNNIRITWPGQRSVDGPRLQVYATSARCEAFTPPAERPVAAPAAPSSPRAAPRTRPQPRPATEADACRIMSGRLFSATTGRELVQHGLIVAGGPSQMKPDLHEYKLHIVGDALSGTTYSVSITWFRGPDC